MNNSPYSGRAFRRGLSNFLTGKALSALLTFAALLWLVRLLPPRDYGVYVTLVALLELGYALGGLGLPWLAARYLPEYRLHAGRTPLTRICGRLLIWQGAALLVLALLAFATLQVYLRWADLDVYRNAALLALFILWLEGMGRFLREGVMSPLMLQGEARASLVGRQIALLLSIGALVWSSKVSVATVVLAELLASACGLVPAAWLTRVRLSRVEPVPRDAQPDWQEPPLRSQWGAALRMYLAQLLSLPVSAQALLTLVQRQVGLEAAAVFGFLRSLQQMIGRYLPATLLVTVIRPRLMAAAITDHSGESMNWQTNLAGKINLFTLMPLICIAAVAGEPLLGALSGGRLAGSGWLMLGFMLALLPTSQRQLLETAAVAVGQARLCVKASWVALLALPLTIGLLYAGAGTWAAVVGLISGQALFVLILYWQLPRKTRFRATWLGLPRLILSSLLAVAVGMVLASFFGPLIGDTTTPQDWVWLAAQSSGVIAAYLASAAIFRPFSPEERERINAFAGRRIFFW